MPAAWRVGCGRGLPQMLQTALQALRGDHWTQARKAKAYLAALLEVSPEESLSRAAAVAARRRTAH